jgi:hypothetical protein
MVLETGKVKWVIFILEKRSILLGLAYLEVTVLSRTAILRICKQYIVADQVFVSDRANGTNLRESQSKRDYYCILGY